MDLVTALAKSSNLAIVDVKLHGWSDDNLSQHSIPDLHESSLLQKGVELLVAPFFRLRGVLCAKIELSAMTKREVRNKIEDIIEEVRKRMMLSEAFGSCLGDEIWSNDMDMDSEEKAMTIELDLKLDELEGEIAACLRLDRFRHWYQYTITMMRLIYDPNVLLSDVLLPSGLDC